MYNDTQRLFLEHALETEGRDKEIFRTLASLCCLPEQGVLLDVGCGGALMAPFFLRWGASRVLGLSNCEKILELAQSFCEDPGYQLRQGDVMELPHKEFDCVLVCGGFHHLENQRSMIRQAHHLLRQEGRMMICFPESRRSVNTRCQKEAGVLPLPTAHTLSRSLEAYFDVDMVIDSPELYVVSGVRKEQ